jgi:hypothetical protein|nr:MAG TPA: hypothetical protein [Caudoviricetes sp.]
MIQLCEDLMKIVSVCAGFVAIVVVVGCTMDDDPKTKDCIRKSARGMAASVIICMVMLVAMCLIVELLKE